MDINRRQWLKNLYAKSVDMGTAPLREKARVAAKRWLRPPFAIDELEFLIQCNRCGECISACPEKIIFPLSAKHPAAAGTPALDLTHGACQLCDGWPCVQACATGALQQNVQTEPPKLAQVTVNPSSCIAYLGLDCGACIQRCPVPGAIQLDNEKPVIGQDCCGCGQCRQDCVAIPKAIEISSKYSVSL